MVAIKSGMNRGLSDKFKLELGSQVKPVLTPLTEPQKTLDSNWIAGFTEAEGCFYSQINNSKTTKSVACAKAVGLVFKIGLHSRDSWVLTKLREQLGCGNIREDSKNRACIFTVTILSAILSIIIPLFNKYDLQGVLRKKKLDYLDFCKIALLLKNKDHFSDQGLELITQIKEGMNTKR